jgi:hypothetical protein
MNREVVCVIGRQGSGKSLWAKLHTLSCTRLLCYDPACSFPSVRWMGESLDPLEALCNAPGGSFRLGSSIALDVPALVSAGFVIGGCMVVIEEAATVWRKGQRLDEWGERLTFYGRHREESLIVVAQRAVSIPIDIRSQATRVVTFQQSEGDDLAWIEDRIGPLVSVLPQLAKWECVDAIDGGRLDRYSIRPQVEARLGVKLDSHEGVGVV